MKQHRIAVIAGDGIGKEVIPAKDFAEKIRAATEYRTDPDFVVIARTDARAVTGFDDAVERANLYRDAGADAIFFEAPQSEEEIRRVAREVNAPLLINMVAGGRTPAVKTSELARLGFKIVIYPGVAMFAAMAAIERALEQLKVTETDGGAGVTSSPMEFFRKVGFDWWHDIEERFSVRSTPPAS